MARKTLAQKIAERKKQMEDRRINFKTSIIAQYLGSQSRTSKDGSDSETHIFSNDRFWIWDYSVECSGSDGSIGGFRREVKYENQTVFHMTGSGGTSYIPGRWEREFNRLFAEAQKKQRESIKAAKAREKKDVKAREKEEAKNWGIRA